MITPRDVRSFVARHRFLLLVLAAAGSAFSDYYGPNVLGLGGSGHHPPAAHAAVRPHAHPAGSGSVARALPPVSSVDHAIAVLPNLVGVNLRQAEKTAAAAGFHRVDSHDARPAGRVQIVDENWRVCSQSPAPGARLPTTVHVTVAVVKLAESCAAGSPASRSAAVTRLPDLVGRSLSDAEAALPGVTVHEQDATGRDRVIIVPGHWKVCSTRPAPGATRPAGAAVTVRAVKTAEPCPRA